MKKITKEEAKYLIKNGFLKRKKGRYPDLHITSKQKKSKRKNYFVPDFYLNNLK